MCLHLNKVDFLFVCQQNLNTKLRHKPLLCVSVTSLLSGESQWAEFINVTCSDFMTSTVSFEPLNGQTAQ